MKTKQLLLHPFNQWVYKCDDNAYSADCYIKPEGVAQVHQFYSSDNNFVLQPGDISIEIYAILSKYNAKKRIKTIQLNVPDEKEEDCFDEMVSVDFEWEPDKQVYSVRT